MTSTGIQPVWSRFELVANASILLPDLPYDERPAQVRRWGLQLMETWWPFDGLEPTPDERQRFLSSLRQAGIDLIALNTTAGDMAAGERGLGAAVHRVDDFRHNLDAAVTLAEQAQGRFVNVLLGNRDGASDDAIEDVVLANLEHAVRRVAGTELTVLIEVLNPADNPDCVLTSLDRAISWIDIVRQRTRTDRIALLFDAYHVTALGENLDAALARACPYLGHVQVADFPGRGAPGTAGIDFAAFVGALDRCGYDGALAFEHLAGERAQLDTTAPSWRTPR